MVRVVPDLVIILTYTYGVPTSSLHTITHRLELRESAAIIINWGA